MNEKVEVESEKVTLIKENVNLQNLLDKQFLNAIDDFKVVTIVFMKQKKDDDFSFVIATYPTKEQFDKKMVSVESEDREAATQLIDLLQK